ncbi:MAG TPA: hypothetical protein VIU93_09170 [Gallionellaceae bacterium]
MSKVIRLDTARRARLQNKARGVTLCQSGFHKWKVLPERRFDVREGRLVATERCERCGLERTSLI